MMKLRLFSILCAASLMVLASCRDHLTGPPNTSTSSSDTIADWTFDGNLNDVSGNGHDGTRGQMTYGADRFGHASSALSFLPDMLAGTEIVTVSDSNGLNFTGNDPYTISVWIQTTDSSAIIIGKGPADGSHPGYQLGISNGLPIAKITSTTGQNSISDYPVPSLSDGQWHLLTLVVGAGHNVTLYADSLLYMTYQDPGMEPELQNTAPLLIGSDPMRTTAFLGSIDNVMILHRALDPVEVAARFHEGGWYEHADTVVSPPQTDTGWSRGNLGTSQAIEGICFPTPNIGYACGFNGTILKSTDSGITWIQVPSNTIENLYRISFKDNFNGVVGGDNGTLLYTSDGGLVWSVLSAPFNTGDNVRDVHYDNELGVGGTIIVTGAGNSGNAGFIFVSHTDGTSWLPSKSTNASLYSIATQFDHAEHYTVVGVKGQALQTTDGGSTWSQDIISGSTVPDFLSVNFYNANAGWASTFYGQLYETSDGGNSWYGQQISGLSDQIRTVKMLSVGEAWAAGNGGVILHTLNDGMDAWPQKSIGGFGSGWNQIVSRDSHSLAFVGDNGTLYWHKE